MNNIYIVFGSQTTAIKIHKEISKQLKLDSELLQTPKKFKLRSCSYSVKINSNDKDKVMDLINKLNVYVVGVYESNI